MTDEEWEAESFTPAGPDTYGRFMRIRVMDMWMHEQDIREAVGPPGTRRGPVRRAGARRGAVGPGLRGGQAAGAPDGSSVTFDLQGPAARQVHVEVDGRAAVVDEPPGPADAVLSMPALTFTRLAGGRTTTPRR